MGIAPRYVEFSQGPQEIPPLKGGIFVFRIQSPCNDLTNLCLVDVMNNARSIFPIDPMGNVFGIPHVNRVDSYSSSLHPIFKNFPIDINIYDDGPLIF